MRIAIISDIHSNYEALKSVLEDIRKRQVDKIFCLGDIIAKGYHPHECLKLIKENCDVVVRGNCDEFFARNQVINEDKPVEKERILFHQKELTKEEKDYLLSLPYCYEFYMSGRLIRLMHATPSSINKSVSMLASIKSRYEMFLPSKNTISDQVADVVIYGHLHVQLASNLYNRTLLNCGSVGNSLCFVRNDAKDANPLNVTNAEYLIIEGDLDEKEHTSFAYQFVNVPYDTEKELMAAKDSNGYTNYEYEIHNGKYSNMNKIYQVWADEGVDISQI